jgi:hypothetical protein
MRRSIRSAFIAAALLASTVLTGTASAEEPAGKIFVNSAAAPYSWTLMTVYEHEGYNATGVYWGIPATANLSWTTHSCWGGGKYDWYAPTVMAVYGLSKLQGYNWASSIKNTAYGSGCNRIWLVAGNGHMYAQCARPGQGISWFGGEYNDNLRQAGLTRDVAACGTAA